MDARRDLGRLRQNVGFFVLIWRGLLCIQDIVFLFLHQNISCRLQTDLSLWYIIHCVDLFLGREFRKGWDRFDQVIVLPSEFRQTDPSRVAGVGYKLSQSSYPGWCQDTVWDFNPCTILWFRFYNSYKFRNAVSDKETRAPRSSVKFLLLGW